MANIEKEINTIAQLEQQRYVLSEFLKEKQQLYTALANQNPKPEPPKQPPNMTVESYPEYDEKKYYEKKKKGANPADGLRAVAASLFVIGIACLTNLITLIIGPIVLLIALACFILSLFVSPVHKRKAARKAYIQECEAIDRRNQYAQNAVEQYQKECVEYERSLQHYETLQKNAIRQKNALDNSIQTATTTYVAISSALESYYANNSALNRYNNYISIITINSYLQNGQCRNLESAIEKFSFEKQCGRISPNIEYALNNRAITQGNMAALFASLDKAAKEREQLQKDSLKYFARLLENDTPPSNNSPIDNYCSELLRLSHTVNFNAKY
ncbi:MAG: hypothetical protein IKB28_11550 [Clostridia bacterium]|nr:hypothetical protein [Clostridia bacterium]